MELREMQEREIKEREKQDEESQDKERQDEKRQGKEIWDRERWKRKTLDRENKKKKIKRVVGFCIMCFSIACTLKNTVYEDFLHYLIAGAGEDRYIIYGKETNYIYYGILLVAVIGYFLIFRFKRLNNKSAIILGAQPGFYLFSFNLVRFLYFIHIGFFVFLLTMDKEFIEHIKKVTREKNRIRIVLTRVFEKICVTAFIIVVMAIIPMSIIYHYKYRDIKADVDMTDYEENGTNYVKNNEDLIKQLSEKTYEGLSQEERLSALQVLVDLQMAFLGVDEEITLYCDSISGQGIAGYADYENNRIVIDSKLVAEKRERAMRTILHESYHIYEHKCVELLDNGKLGELGDEVNNLRFFKEVEQWKYEFENYYSFEEEGEETGVYDYQSVEIEADAYADRWIGVYLSYVEK